MSNPSALVVESSAPTAVLFIENEDTLLAIESDSPVILEIYDVGIPGPPGPQMDIFVLPLAPN